VKYRTIVADPPWPCHGMRRANVLRGEHYRVMTLDEITALPVADLAEEDAHLYCWAVLPLMAEAYDVVRAWGFAPITCLTWCKPGPGLGGGFRGNTEHLIVARRGEVFYNPTCSVCGGRARGAVKCSCERPEWRYRGERTVYARQFADVAEGTWYRAPRAEHSAKPDLFTDLIERMSPGPYVELFARRARFGWDYWGDESLGTAEMAA
jgi:N6-adenosine-specific RNA methylase IME4